MTVFRITEGEICIYNDPKLHHCAYADSLFPKVRKHGNSKGAVFSEKVD